MTSLLHEVEPGNADSMNVIIEIPRGSKNKYEIDKKTGLIALDRAAHTAQDFPFDYGFVPQTWWDDDDPIDVIVLTTFPLHPGVLVRVRPVGLMNMIDGGDADDKIIGVPVDDPRWEDVRDLSDINKHTLKEMQHFYENYKKLQDGEHIEITGFKDASAAKGVFERGRKLYMERVAK